MAQVNYKSGFPPNFTETLPVAPTMTISLPGRSIVKDNHTDRVIKTYLPNGQQ